MRHKITICFGATLSIVAVAWVYLGSISDRLAGNETMLTEAPACDDNTACEKYRNLFVADAHSDTLLHRDPSEFSNMGHVDLHRLVNGGVDLQIFAVASVAPKLATLDGKVCGNWELGDRLTKLFVLKEPTRPEAWTSPMARVHRMIERFDRSVSKAESASVSLRKIESQVDLTEVFESNGSSGTPVVGAILAIEGAYWAATNEAEISEQLDALYIAGVRMIGLTHRSSNHLAGSNEDCTDRSGLTSLGKFMVSEIWRRNMILDLAHASSATIRDVAELAAERITGPVIVSHTGIQSACDHDRNLTNEDVQNVVRMGGVVSIGFWSTVNCFGSNARIDEARRAIARSFGMAYLAMSTPEFISEMGSGYDPSDHLALGSDFDGATLVPADASAIPWYLEGIAKAEPGGDLLFDDASIEKIAGLNLLRLLSDALKH